MIYTSNLQIYVVLAEETEQTACIFCTNLRLNQKHVFRKPHDYV